MTDIVERARAYARNCGGPPEEYLTWQLADEIERMRAEIADYRNFRKHDLAEIERLQAERDGLLTGSGKLLAEIERLKAALQLAQRWAGLAADALQPSAEQNERFKAALTGLLKHDYAEECQECGIGRSAAWKNARAALEGRTALPARETWGKRRPGE